MLKRDPKEVLTKQHLQALRGMYSINYEYCTMSCMLPDNVIDDLTPEVFRAFVHIEDDIYFLTVDDFFFKGGNYICKDDSSICVDMESMPREVLDLFVFCIGGGDYEDRPLGDYESDDDDCGDDDDGW